MIKYDLIIVAGQPFPYGMAATNRILSYAKEIAKHKKVLFLTFAGPDYSQTSANKDRKGNFGGIDYEYMGLSFVYPKPMVLKRMVFLVWRYVKILLLIMFKYKAKSILLYCSGNYISIPTKIICTLKSQKMFQDVTETIDKYKDGYINEKMLLWRCRLFDGIIVISSAIKECLSKYQDNLFLLPVLVDFERFKVSSHKSKYFFFCSGSNLQRDGLADCIKGFLIFSQRHPEYVFEIASSINEKDPYHQLCKQMMDDNSDRIHYLGPLSSSLIPEKLSQATALLITPHKAYTTMGFPTKMGEYLTSGTPVVCSRIKDLKEILDEDTVFYVNPNSPHEIAERLDEIISNPALAISRGLSGRQFMKCSYTADSFSEKLMSFLGL